MIDHRTFLARVDACLDARRDPLDDPDVLAFLDAHPEHLEAFVAQRADLRALGAMADDLPAPPARPAAARRLRPPLPLVAAAAAAAAVIVWSLRADDAPGAPRGGSRILSATLEETAPRLYAGADYTVFQPLVRAERTTFETYEHLSLERKR